MAEATDHTLTDNLIEGIRGIVSEARGEGKTQEEVTEEVRYQFETQAEDED